MNWPSLISHILAGVFLVVCGCRSEVLEGLEETEANEILVRLSQTGIDARKERTGTGKSATYAVTVSPGAVEHAVVSLKAVGLPRTRHDGFSAVYKDRAIVPGQFEEQAVFLSALQEELCLSLESVQGVLWSRVHVTLRPRSPTMGLGNSKSPIVQSASVLLGYAEDGNAKPPLSEQQVQILVANAVDGLDADSVAVVFSAVCQNSELSSMTVSQASTAGVLRWALFVLAVAALATAAMITGRKFALWPWGKGASS